MADAPQTTDYRLPTGPYVEVRQRARHQYTAEEYAAVEALGARVEAWPRECGWVRVDLVQWDNLGDRVPVLEAVRNANEWLDELERGGR